MSKSLAATFSRELRAARQARGWTQSELAERVGIAVEVCGRLERGSALPRADTLARLARELGVTADKLLGIESERAGGVSHRAAAEPEAEYAEHPGMRRLVRRLKKESPRTIRLLEALVSSFRADQARRGRAG